MASCQPAGRGRKRRNCHTKLKQGARFYRDTSFRKDVSCSARRAGSVVSGTTQQPIPVAFDRPSARPFSFQAKRRGAA